MLFTGNFRFEVVLNHGDNLFIIANSISTIDSAQTPNVNTTAKFGWTFDIFYYSEGRQDYYTDFSPTLNYISNMK